MPLESVRCPLCSSESRPHFSKFSDVYFRCNCGFVFIWPRPSESCLREMYEQHGTDYWTNDLMIEFAFSPTKSRREINFLRRFASVGTLLDIGCSTGSFVKAASDAGFDADGVDISSASVRCGQRLGLKLYAMDILKESPRPKYDIITLWATLEHLAEPLIHLRRAKELLNPGGLLFVSVPNYAGITQKLIGKWDRYVCREHLNCFKPHVLHRTIASAQLSIQGTTTYAFNPVVLLKDIQHRGRKEYQPEDQQPDVSTTLKVKRSFLARAQDPIEKALNLLSLGDVVAVCAQLTIK